MSPRPHTHIYLGEIRRTQPRKAFSIANMRLHARGWRRCFRCSVKTLAKRLERTRA
jgi:hypothetical protein